MEQHLGRMPRLVHAVYRRALRNCPWVGSLWAGAMRAAERLGSPESDLEALYNEALQAGMQTQEDYMEVSIQHWWQNMHRQCISMPLESIEGTSISFEVLCSACHAEQASAQAC